MRFLSKISVLGLIVALVGCGNQQTDSSHDDSQGGKKKHSLVTEDGSAISLSGQEGEVASTDQEVLLAVFVPESKYINADNKSIFENKLRQVITNYGIGANETSNLMLTAAIVPISKDIVPTNPPRVSEKLELTLYVVDYVENRVYGNTSFEIQGVGTSDGLATRNALNSINTKSNEFAKLVNESKQKIADYYNSNYPQIIAKAKSLAAMQNYDEAMDKLLAIPMFCEGYESALDEIAIVSKQKGDIDGRKLLQQARSLWASNVARNGTSVMDKSDAAVQALDLIAQINPLASCQTEATALVNEICTKMDAVNRENKEWMMRVKNYEDRLAMQKQAMADKKEIRLAEIAKAKNGRDLARLERAKNGQGAFSFNLFSIGSGNTFQNANAENNETSIGF